MCLANDNNKQVRAFAARLALDHDGLASFMKSVPGQSS